MTNSTEWPKDKPFKVSSNMATGERLTRTVEARQFFTNEQDARAAFAAPRVRNECSRVIAVLHFDKPNNYGNRDTLECLGVKKFRKP